MSEIKASDLRIGNYLENFLGEIFQANSETIKCFETNYFHGFDKPKPIRLTEDILFRLGFENKEHIGKGWSKDGVDYWFDKNEGIHIQSICQTKTLCFLHQLQTLHYLMCGKELELKEI